MINFEVNRGQKYLVTERPNSETPAPLKKLGRMKKTKTSEPIFCIYDDKRKRYDTGLNKYSREFDGKSQAEIDKILEERKELIEYLTSLVETSGKSEEDFLSEFPLNVTHNITIDTSSTDTWLRLYLAMRGNDLCPTTDQYNPKYNSALYQIESRSTTQKREEIVAEMRMEAVKWVLDKLTNNREEAIDFLRYLDIIGLTHAKKTDTLLFQTFEKKIDSDFKLLEDFVDAIKTQSWTDIKTLNTVRKAIITKKISKDGNVYTFNGTEIGRDATDITRNLKKTEFAEIAYKLLGEEEEHDDL